MAHPVAEVERWAWRRGTAGWRPFVGAPCSSPSRRWWSSWPRRARWPCPAT